MVKDSTTERQSEQLERLFLHGNRILDTDRSSAASAGEGLHRQSVDPERCIRS
jgi:hypothetical protein